MKEAPEDREPQQPSRPATGFGEGQPVRVDATTPEPPRAPTLSARLQASGDERRVREALERRSTQRGLLVIALLVLAICLFRAGLDRAFPAGWLRRW